MPRRSSPAWLPGRPRRPATGGKASVPRKAPGPAGITTSSTAHKREEAAMQGRCGASWGAPESGEQEQQQQQQGLLPPSAQLQATFRSVVIALGNGRYCAGAARGPLGVVVRGVFRQGPPAKWAELRLGWPANCLGAVAGAEPPSRQDPALRRFDANATYGLAGGRTEPTA